MTDTFKSAEEEARKARIKAMQTSGITPETLDAATQVQVLLQDPKTVTAYTQLADKIAKSKGVDLQKLNDIEKGAVLSRAGEALTPQDMLEIARAKKSNGDDAARKLLLDKAKPSLENAFDDYKAGRLTVGSQGPNYSAEQKRFNAEIAKGMKSGGVEGAVAAALKQFPEMAKAAMPTQAQLDEAFNKAAAKQAESFRRELQAIAGATASLKTIPAVQITDIDALLNNGTTKRAITDSLGQDERRFFKKLPADTQEHLLSSVAAKIKESGKGPEILRLYNEGNMVDANRIIVEIGAPALKAGMQEIKPEQKSSGKPSAQATEQQSPTGKTAAQMSPAELQAHLNALVSGDKNANGGKTKLFVPQ